MKKKRKKAKKKIFKKKKKQTRKKTRRSKKIKNALQNFIIVYQNIWFTSKVDSVQELPDDGQPNLLGLVETHIQVEEKITLGYKIIYRDDKTSNSGGIIIGVKDAIKTTTIQVMQESQVGQALWILVNNQKKKINVRVICAP